MSPLTRPRKAVSSRRPTLAQVAAHAGVSVSTASRVLNGYDQGFSLTPERRDAVLDAVRQLGYRPDAIGSLLKSRRTLIVAVHGYITNTRPLPSVHSVMLGYAADRLAQHGCEVCARVHSTPADSFVPFPWRIDGALIHSMRGNERTDTFDDNAVPYVVMNGPAGPGGFAVRVDENDALDQAIDHLGALGHRRIAYRGTERSRMHESVPARHAAVHHRLAQQGFDAPEAPATAEGAAEAFLRRHIERDGATAVIAYSHIEALSLLFAATRMGWSIPQRFSLVSFNDVYPSEEVGLTTIALPLQQIGETAADLLWNAMTAPDPVQRRHVALPAELRIRTSTAPPPA